MDVSLYPVECKSLVQEAEIAFSRWELGGTWETKYCNDSNRTAGDGQARITVSSVIGRHDDYILVGGKGAAIVSYLPWKSLDSTPLYRSSNLN